MPRISPTLEGFRAAIRRPVLTFAEIAWRWTVGAVAWTLFIFSCSEYLNTLPVTRGDKALLGTRQPLLIGKAISHILHGSLNRAVFAVLVGAAALVVLWIIAASIGRMATVRALLEYFERDVPSNVSTEAVSTLPIGPLFALNFLRAAVALGAILALVGAAILAGLASPDKNPRPGLAFILFLPCAALICMAWPALNWLLSLASIFATRDGEDALGALSTAVTLCRERMGAVSAVGAWTGMAHLTAFSIMGTAVSLPMAFIQVAPGRLVLAVIILIALAYFAIVDWLYMARLAGYVYIAEMPDVPAESAILPAPPFSGQTIVPQTAIDRDEPILSDLPNLAVET